MNTPAGTRVGGSWRVAARVETTAKAAVPTPSAATTAASPRTLAAGLFVSRRRKPSVSLLTTCCASPAPQRSAVQRLTHHPQGPRSPGAPANCPVSCRRQWDQLGGSGGNLLLAEDAEDGAGKAGGPTALFHDQPLRGRGAAPGAAGLGGSSHPPECSSQLHVRPPASGGMTSCPVSPSVAGRSTDGPLFWSTPRGRARSRPDRCSLHT